MREAPLHCGRRLYTPHELLARVKPSQEACAGIAAWCSIRAEYGATRKEVWEQGVAGSSPVAPTTLIRRPRRSFRSGQDVECRPETHGRSIRVQAMLCRHVAPGRGIVRPSVRSIRLLSREQAERSA